MEEKIGIAVVVMTLLALLPLAIWNTPTGRVVSEISGSTDQEMSRFVFYHSLREAPNGQYMDSCYPKGEIMTIIPGAKCCEGLSPVMVFDEEQQDCVGVSGVAVCVECGNGLCEYGENSCNCKADCYK